MISPRNVSKRLGKVSEVHWGLHQFKALEHLSHTKHFNFYSPYPLSKC